ncbi:MAG: hypothetical protein LKI53_07750 [Bacteroidales bacterium]|jgi:hypothetical protein|nr:hypothetical protein [Bacteroidales bacterium]
MKGYRVISIIFIMICFLSGCKNSGHTGIILRKTEAFCKGNIDSTRKVISQININDIRHKSQKARYALLYARLIPYSSNGFEKIRRDSIINIAVKYYRNKKKYKSNYAESLYYQAHSKADIMDYKQALDAEKKAEIVAGEIKDYELLAKIYEHMGALHNRLLSEDSVRIEKYKKSAKAFLMAKEPDKANLKYSVIGFYYLNVPDYDSAYAYISKSISYFKKTGNKERLEGRYIILMKYYEAKENFEKERVLGLKLLRDYPDKRNSETKRLLASTYAHLGKIDSAWIYYREYDNFSSNKSRNNIKTLSEIEELSGNYKKAMNLYKYLYTTTDTTYMRKQKIKATTIEKKFDYQKLIANEKVIAYKHHLRTYILISASAILFLILMLVLNISITRKKRIISENAACIEKLRSESEEKDNTQQKLKTVLDKRFDKLDRLMELSYRYKAFGTAFYEGFKNIVGNGKVDKKILSDICDAINAKHHGIIDIIRQEHPEINEDDIYFISLLCNGFSSSTICAFYEYKNTNMVYVRKSRLTHKMNLDIPLNTYITELMDQLAAEKA